MCVVINWRGVCLGGEGGGGSNDQLGVYTFLGGAGKCITYWNVLIFNSLLIVLCRSQLLIMESHL